MKTFDFQFALNFQLLEPDIICFAQGECQNSILISESITVGENGCLKFCQNTEGCNWFTYNSKRTFCMAFATCSEVVADACPDCLSGQVISNKSVLYKKILLGKI
jgi:hypothetical protein